jgi:preprotein translocase subunit SecA
MAGRGTDIVLGGNWEVEGRQSAGRHARSRSPRSNWQQRHQQVIESGGLHVIAPNAMSRVVSIISCVAAPPSG